jgi:hypothetical protein
LLKYTEVLFSGDENARLPRHGIEKPPAFNHISFGMYFHIVHKLNLLFVAEFLPQTLRLCLAVSGSREQTAHFRRVRH